MSDPNLLTQRQIQDLQDGHERLRKADVPSIYLPWSQRVLNPFPLASSGGVWGDIGQPWGATLLAFNVSVFVATTNNGANFWTLTLTDAAASVLASITTSAIAANTVTRLSTTAFTQPGVSNASLSIIATATLAPGAIFIWPALALLRTGN